MRVLVTGATGFIGSALLPRLKAKGHDVTPVVRSSAHQLGGWKPLLIPELADIEPSKIEGYDAIVHLAGHAHRRSKIPGIHHRVNCTTTLAVAESAVIAGVGRFVFLSSAKVHGESSEQPLSSESPYKASDEYSASKIAAEIALARITAPMSIIALRPPLVYGPGAKGNLASLERLAHRGVPLPTPRVCNRRSFISIENLVSAIAVAVTASGTGFHGYVIHDSSPRSAVDLFLGLYPEGRVLKLPGKFMSVLNLASGFLLGRRILGPLTDNFVLECKLFSAATGWVPK